MKKAQREGVAFASILKLATSAYVSGAFGIQLVPQPKLNAKTRKMLIRESREIKEGKNISPLFDNARDAIAYLKNL